MKKNISYLSYDNSDKKLYSRSVEILDNLFGSGNYILDENESNILFIAIGGSEKLALRMVESNNNFILLCHRESNSFAAAMEIAAYIRANNKRVEVIDVLAENSIEQFLLTQRVFRAIDSLIDQKAALIGEVSDWLIISDVENDAISNKLGIEMMRLPWKQFQSYKDMEPSQEFLDCFKGHNTDKLINTARVYSLLDKISKDNNLSAMSVECFSMVMRDKVTACLPLAVFNAKNTVAACEGDVCAMIGKMIIRSLTGEIPWQANIAEIKVDSVLFAHCSAPLHMLSSFNITTHFETNVGTAIQGNISYDKIGVFRIDNALDKYMLLEGIITETPKHNFACRTQIEFKTTEYETELLRNKSLGNHHLIFPAEYIPLVIKLMSVLGITRVS